MSDRFQIPAHEHGVVRLFSVDTEAEPPVMSAERDWDTLDDDGEPIWPLRDALGVTYLDGDFIELFDVADLGELGLSGYMITGLGISETDVNEDRARLDAITGMVLIVMSPAFGGFAETLTPKSPLRWIGTYTEEGAPVSFKPLPSEAAKGAPLPSKPAPSDAAMSGRIAVLALLVIFALTAVVVWVAA